MNYPLWLLGLGLLFVFAERLWPRRPGQPIFRKGIWSDLVYIVFNSDYLGILLSQASLYAIEVLRLDRLPMGLLKDWSFAIQFATLLVTFDLIRWLIHNLLHRVPVLWEFHKVHHSIVDMDWLGDWRFHWMEVIVYNSILYIPAAILGFRGDVMFSVGIVNTFVGHFAHANLRFQIGPLKYLVNSPEMHIWHHNHPDSGPINRNFGITLSIWDWIFGTAHVPAHEDPRRLGFAGIESYPAQLPGQWVAPFRALLK
jgi:sterol desaturase/sphingolipid hydroxylase (fatty acid hydroxylase superfamily)